MILVVGATGSLGGRVTRSLLEQGREVRILARHNPISEEMAKMGRANRVQALADAGAQPVEGDLKDAASLAVACRGVDTVITTATATQRGGDDTIESVDLQGNFNLIEAARQAGVKRFIFTSVTGASADHPVRLFQIKGAAEAALEKSGMQWTIVWPSVFMEIWIGMVVGMPLQAQQPISLLGKGDHKHNYISEPDVAKFEVAALDNPRTVNQRLIIGGPRSYTWTEVVDCVSDVLGSRLPVQYLPLGSPVPLLPPEGVVLFNAFETFEDELDMTQTAATYGVTLTTLDEYIRRTFVH